MLTEELLDFILHERNEAMDFVAWARENPYSDIYLYGAGDGLCYAVDFMKKYQVRIKAILDTRRGGDALCYQGIPILRFSEFLAQNPEKDSKFVITAASAAQEITEMLCFHFPKHNVFFFEMAGYLQYIPDIEQYRKYLVGNWSKLSELYDSFADDKSRKTLELVLKGRISANPLYFWQSYVPDQYYPQDIMPSLAEETMVELGANNGETLLEFIDHCPNYKAIYCFEPEPKCFNNLKRIASGLGENVHLIPKGAWNCSTVLGFSSRGSGGVASSIVNESGKDADNQIETAAIDDIVKEPVSFIKMDIEGSELQALRGAERTILSYHPKLAICVYHRVEDFLDIWDYLHTLVPKYQFYLRHHYPTTISETVLYAIASN